VRRVLATTLTILAVPGTASADWQTLERGDRGPQVELVQQALTAVGIRTATDGAYGPGTARSVRRYERRVRIPVDGRVSRGQARGLFKRAEMDPALVDQEQSRAQPRSVSAGGGGSFPIAGKWEWGRGMSGGHEGVDVMADCGTPLIAPEGGKVVRIASQASAGNYVVVRAPSGEDHVFMHLDAPATVAKGAELAPGASIGAVGRSGNASTCHLHFEIWTAPGWYEGGAARDPKPDLDRWAGEAAQPS
jgi:murein DD-endopeptidase MepM/ murein hydrolase activator NlpD